MTALGGAMRQLVSTPLVPLANCSEEGNGAPRLDSAVFLNKWLLDMQLRVSAAEVERHRMLKSALHAFIAERFYGTLEAMVEDASMALYERLCATPEDEIEEDTPDPLDFDLPARENE